jgi:integrase
MVTIKKFYQWVRGFEWNSREYPECVKWIKTTLKNNKRKLPEDILSKKEIRKLIDFAGHPRNKAMISVLYEGGLRAGEILNMKIKHVSFDKYGAVIMVNGKTGPRRVRLVTSVKHLATWLEHHPRRENLESPLWVTISSNSKGAPMDYPVFRKTLRKIAKKAGIKKAVNPHSFRHAAATHYSKYLTEAQMNQMFGWTQGSNMPSIYVHLSGRDVDNAILKMHGLKTNGNGEDLVECPRCEKSNSEEKRFCGDCGQPLSLQVAMEADKERAEFEKERSGYDDLMSEIMKRLVKRKETKKIVEKILKEIKKEEK